MTLAMIYPEPGSRTKKDAAKAAESGGFSLADLSVAEPTLETVFIGLTGKDLRD